MNDSEQPNAKKASEVAALFLNMGADLVRKLPQDNGRTMSLGVAMFVGAFLATLKHRVDRERFCEAALEFAKRTDKGLADEGFDFNLPNGPVQ